MQYSELFKRKMVQKMTGPDAISATALSKQVDVSQTTLSQWLRQAGIEPPFGYPNNCSDTVQKRPSVTGKSPKDWSPEEKLKAVVESAQLTDEQLGAYLRRKGLHETHLQQWRLQMLHGLSKRASAPKSKVDADQAKKSGAWKRSCNEKTRLLQKPPRF